MSNLAELNQCTGCTACASSCPKECITMIVDKNGFQYPKVNEAACVGCSLCEKSCPIVVPLTRSMTLPITYAALSKDESVRMNSSSGGIFTEIAKRIIGQNGTAYGAAYTDSFDVEHICVNNVDDLGKLHGAKYAQSNLQQIFVDIRRKLEAGEEVLFSGTPCQVAGLKSFLKKDYENLFCVDFICHGVPSPMAWKEYVNYRSKLDADGELPVEINLREKNTGWSRYQYSNVFKYADGTKHSVLSSQSLFMKLFVGDYISRTSCANCQFKGYSRVSDITLGDFWGIWDIDLEMDDNKGTSVVLIQSEKGQALWNSINDKIKFKEVTLEQASCQNPSMLHSSAAKQNRDEVLTMIREGKIGELENMFSESPSKNISFIQRIVRRLKRV